MHVLSSSNHGLAGLSEDMRSNFNLMKDMGSHTRVDPEGRKKSLMGLMAKITSTPEANSELTDFGLQFEESMVTFRGRALPPEKIMTRSGTSVYRVGEPDWTRDVRSAKLVSTQDIDVKLLLFE